MIRGCGRARDDQSTELERPDALKNSWPSAAPTVAL
jgi:hypothetical protein